MKPYGFYWQLVHAKSNRCIRDGFHRGAQSPDWTEKVAGFEYRFLPLYEHAEKHAPRVTPAQIHALQLCAEGLSETGRVVQRIRRDLLNRMVEQGWIRFRPYAREPHWALTPAGRELVGRK